MILLTIEPRVTLDWQTFCKKTPAYSIALDGYVLGAPRYDPSGPRANFNHHEEVDRLATRSTAGQAHLAIKQGLFDTFQVEGKPSAHLYVNDCDEDVCLSTWALMHGEQVHLMDEKSPLEALLTITDRLDATAGTYPIDPKDALVQTQAWIFEPYTSARSAGLIGQMDRTHMRDIINTVHKRIDKHLDGKAERIELDTRYEPIAVRKSWIFAREKGAYARAAIFAGGHDAYVLERGPGRYVIGRRSVYVPMPLERIAQLLNAAEHIPADATNRWGGGDTIIGSPREGGSKLNDVQIFSIVDTAIENEKRKKR